MSLEDFSDDGTSHGFSSEENERHAIEQIELELEELSVDEDEEIRAHPKIEYETEFGESPINEVREVPSESAMSISVSQSSIRDYGPTSEKEIIQRTESSISVQRVESSNSKIQRVQTTEEIQAPSPISPLPSLGSFNQIELEKVSSSAAEPQEIKPTSSEPKIGDDSESTPQRIQSHESPSFYPPTKIQPSDSQGLVHFQFSLKIYPFKVFLRHANEN